MIVDYCKKEGRVLGVGLNCEKCPNKPFPYGFCGFLRLMDDKNIKKDSKI